MLKNYEKKKNNPQNKSIHEACLLHIFLKKVFDLNSMLCYLVLQSIVLHTVVKHQFHVMTELVNIVIDIESQFLLYCTKIHRMLNYVEVIVNVVTTWINRFVKVVTSFWFPAYWQHLLSYLHPRFFLLYLFQIWYVNSLWISQLFLEVRKVSKKFLEFSCWYLICIS